MEKIHDRMPAVLHPSEFSNWLNTDNQSPSFLTDLLRPSPADGLGEYIVSKAVGNVRNNNESIIQKSRLIRLTHKQVLLIFFLHKPPVHGIQNIDQVKESVMVGFCYVVQLFGNHCVFRALRAFRYTDNFTGIFINPKLIEPVQIDRMVYFLMLIF